MLDEYSFVQAFLLRGLRSLSLCVCLLDYLWGGEKMNAENERKGLTRGLIGRGIEYIELNLLLGH